MGITLRQTLCAGPCPKVSVLERIHGICVEKILFEIHTYKNARKYLTIGGATSCCWSCVEEASVKREFYMYIFLSYYFHVVAFCLLMMRKSVL